MMPAEALITLRARGARITLVDGDLTVTPRSALDPEIREVLRQAKPMVVAILKGEVRLPDPTPVPVPCTHCRGSIFWRKDGTTELICGTCQPNPDPGACAGYFAATGDPLDVLLKLDVRAALDWLLREDTPAADTIITLIAAVDRGDDGAVSKLLTAIGVAVDRYDRRVARGRSS